RQRLPLLLPPGQRRLLAAAPHRRPRSMGDTRRRPKVAQAVAEILARRPALLRCSVFLRPNVAALRALRFAARQCNSGSLPAVSARRATAAKERVARRTRPRRAPQSA